MTGGTYVLAIELPRPASVAFGALGERALEAGVYAYVGSAFGPGGLSRVGRHRAVAAGENGTRHWHVDYLTGHPDARIAEAVRLPGADVECALARWIGGEPVEGAGASDCGCPAHLVRVPGRTELRRSVAAAWRDHDPDDPPP